MTEAIFGTHDEKTLVQLRDVATRAERVALMADGSDTLPLPAFSDSCGERIRSNFRQLR